MSRANMCCISDFPQRVVSAGYEIWDNNQHEINEVVLILFYHSVKHQLVLYSSSQRRKYKLWQMSFQISYENPSGVCNSFALLICSGLYCSLNLESDRNFLLDQTDKFLMLVLLSLSSLSVNSTLHIIIWILSLENTSGFFLLFSPQNLLGIQKHKHLSHKKHNQHCSK